MRVLLLAILLALLTQQPDPPQLTVYGAGGETCATATNADTLTADPPGRVEPLPPESALTPTSAPSGVLTLCWPEPPRRVTATGPGGVATWPSDVPAPTPLPTRPQPTSAPVEWPARQILVPMLNG